MLTLNQEVELFKNFVLKHESLNDFFFGDEIDTANQYKYPLFRASLQSSENNNGQVVRKYLFELSDLVNLDASNETQVLSDTELMCFDFHNYIRLVSKTKLLGSINVSDSISLTGFTERNDTMVSGHYFELELSSHMSNYSCSLPIAAGNLLDDNYIYVGGNYAPPMTGDFTVLIKDQDGNVIQTFTTSGEYMVNILTGIQQVIGNTTPVIIQNII
jgi:hypothetical protein